MTVGMNGRDMQNAVLALYGMIARPGTTLCRISDNPGMYLVPSVAVFATTVALAVLLPWGYVGYQMNDIQWDDALYRLIIGSMQGMLPIIGIFWVGRRWGGNRSFRRAFPVLAYCLVPSILGILATTAAESLYSLTVPDIVLSDGLILTSGSGIPFGLFQSAIGFFFIGWTFLLQVKAIHILNGFGYARSAAVLVLAILIVYAGNITYGLVTAVISEFVL